MKMTIYTNEWGRTRYYVDMTTGNIWYDGIQPSGNWKFKGFSHLRRNEIIPFSVIQKNQQITKKDSFWFKNGLSQYRVRDLDYGTTREWGSRITGISFSD